MVDITASEQFTVLPKQAWSARWANKRINIWEGPIRSGKTYGSFIPFTSFTADAPRGNLYIIGKTLDTVERNLLRPLADLLGPGFEYSKGNGEAWLDGRRIDLLSAYDESSYKRLRGSTCAGWLGDEMTLWPQSFFVELLGRMSAPGAKGFGTTNPDSPFHWFKADYLDRFKALDWRRFRFLIEDNPILPDEYVRSIKREYGPPNSMWYRRLILGMWVLAAGLVYSMFDLDRHVVSAPGRFAYYGVSVDYGTVNPTAFGLFGWNPGRPVYLLKLYWHDSSEKGRIKTDKDYADDFEAFTQGIPLRYVVVDPSARSFIAELESRGIAVRRAINDVLDGIRYVATRLNTESFLLSRDPSLKPALGEFGTYVWDEKAQEQGKDKPLKQHDHAMDLIRYFFYTLFFRRNPDAKFKPVS